MDVFVVPQEGSPFCIEVHIVDKVLTIKQKIEKSQGIPVSKQTLYFGGKVLEDDLTIIRNQIPPNARLLLFISPDYNPNQNNDQGLQTQEAAPSNPIDDFVNNPGWPAMGNQMLQTEQSPIPDKTIESVANFLGFQDWAALVEDESDQLLHQTQQSAVPSDSIGATFFGEDLALTTEHFSNIQSVWPPGITQEETNYGQDLSGMVRSNNNESLPSSTSAEILGIQGLPPVKVWSNTNQVTGTKKPPRPPNSVKEIIDITDSPVKKKIKMSPIPMKLTVMVMPFKETRKIPVNVNAGDNVEVLKNELVKMQQRGELALPQEGYFFIHNGRVLDDDQSFWQNGVAHNDTIEIFRGSYTCGGDPAITRFRTFAS